MKKSMHVKAAAITLIILIRVMPLITVASPSSQSIPTATFVQVDLPTPLPIVPTATNASSVNPIERTATPEGLAFLEAITEANVRAQADPDSERLGTIRTGEQYIVIGRYFRWYQFQYNQSPSGTGWVFDELVQISGNENNIRDLSVSTPTVDLAASEISGTIAFITQTPGGLMTATAGAGVIPLPIATGENLTSGTGNPLISTTLLPTFTAPPNFVPLATIAEGNNSVVPTGIPRSSDNLEMSRIPPILPIVLLGGAGMLGLLISSKRR